MDHFLFFFFVWTLGPRGRRGASVLGRVLLVCLVIAAGAAKVACLAGKCCCSFAAEGSMIQQRFFPPLTGVFLLRWGRKRNKCPREGVKGCFLICEVWGCKFNPGPFPPTPVSWSGCKGGCGSGIERSLFIMTSHTFFLRQINAFLTVDVGNFLTKLYRTLAN